MKKFAAMAGIFVFALVGSVVSNAADIAVLDLDAVAKAIGWDEQLNEALQARGQALDEKLGQKKSQFEKLLDDRREKLGESPSEDDQRKLVEFQVRANRQLQSDLQNSQQQMVQYRAELVTGFRDKLRPLAGAIAKKKGMSIVVLKTDPVFFHAEEADITNELIARVNSNASLKKSLDVSELAGAAAE